MKITKSQLKQIIKEELTQAEKARKAALEKEVEYPAELRRAQVEDELEDLEHK